MIFMASAICLCKETHAAQQSWGTHGQVACDALTGADADHCPSCPSHDQTDSDHCASSCDCSCHLSVTVPPVSIRFSPVVTDLVFFEPFTALPEVYLSKFIPPHILV